MSAGTTNSQGLACRRPSCCESPSGRFKQGEHPSKWLEKYIAGNHWQPQKKIEKSCTTVLKVLICFNPFKVFSKAFSIFLKGYTSVHTSGDHAQTKRTCIWSQLQIAEHGALFFFILHVIDLVSMSPDSHRFTPGPWALGCSSFLGIPFQQQMITIWGNPPVGASGADMKLDVSTTDPQKLSGFKRSDRDDLRVKKLYEPMYS